MPQMLFNKNLPGISTALLNYGPRSLLAHWPEQILLHNEPGERVLSSIYAGLNVAQ